MRHPAAVSRPIPGRDRELDQIAAFLTQAGPAMLLVTGAPGIGKSTLLRCGVALATERGMRVLAFRPGEAEATLSYSGLAGLLPDAVLDEVWEAVPAARRDALRTALGRGGSPSPAVDAGVVGLGVLSALQALCRGGLALVIDDQQWLDAASLVAVGFALRRLEAQPVLVLASARAGGGPAVTPLEDAVDEPRRSRILLGPLPVGALSQLVQERLHVALPRLAAVQLATESGGNPLVALELARAAAVGGRVPGPGERFLPTTDVTTLLGTRISALPPTARDALHLIAAAARPDLALLAGCLGEAAAHAAIAELVSAQLVVVEGQVLRCTHPLVASAAYAQLLPHRRREVHRRLAAAVPDDEERVRHLAVGTEGPDESVAVALDEAARTAHRRGAPAAAAALCALAVEATVPTDLPRLVDRELELARRQLEAGDGDQARETAVRALTRRPAGPSRVDVLLLLSAIEQERGELAGSRRWLAQALAEAGDDRAAAARAHVTAGMTAWEDVDVERSHAAAAVDALAGHEDEDPSTAAVALVLLAGTDFEAGRGLRVDLLDRAVELESRTDLMAMMRPSTQRAVFLGHAGRVVESVSAIQACLARAEVEGDQSCRPHLLRSLAWMELGAGALSDAWVHIEQAMAVADELALSDAYIWAVAGQVAAVRGDTDVAAGLCSRALARAREVGNPWAEVRALGASGFLELTTHRPAVAAETLCTATTIVAAEHVVDVGWHRLHGDLVEALVGASRPDDAVRASSSFGASARRTGHPWSLAVAARCAGLVACATGRTEEAVRAFEESLSAPAMAYLPFERARSLLALGTCLRRGNRRRAARHALAEAASTFDNLGSRSWAETAHRELAAVSGRTAITDLTAMQSRVAALAADGRTNGEIATELFLSVRTVESHLATTYRKLGTRSRTELAAIFREKMR